MIQKTSLRDKIFDLLENHAGKEIDCNAEEGDKDRISQVALADAISALVFDMIVEDSKDDIHRLVFAKKR